MNSRTSFRRRGLPSELADDGDDSDPESPMSSTDDEKKPLGPPPGRHLHKRKSFIPGVDDERKDGVTPQDQTAEAINFFGNERTPAALIAGSALSIMYAFPLQKSDASDIAFIKRLYLLLATCAFLNGLIAVYTSSLAITRLLAKVHNPISRDALVMMLRETPIYYLGARAHFLTSLLCFVAALTLRMWAEYSEQTPRFARALVCLCGACLAYQLALYNMTLVHFHSFFHLWYCYLRCLFEHTFTRKPKVGKSAGFSGLLALVLIAIAMVDLLHIGTYYTKEGVATVMNATLLADNVPTGS